MILIIDHKLQFLFSMLIRCTGYMKGSRLKKFFKIQSSHFDLLDISGVGLSFSFFVNEILKKQGKLKRKITIE